MWMAYAPQQGSCNAVPLLSGRLVVQGASPYTPPHQTGPTRWAPADTCPQAGHYQLPGGLPCYPGVPKPNGGSGLVDGAQSTVGIQGPWIVHEADRAIKVTHLLSCTGPICFWHGQAHPNATSRHALVHFHSILQGIWFLHVGPYALIGSPPHTRVYL